MACSWVLACTRALAEVWLELRVSYRREARASGRLASVGLVSLACTGGVWAGDRSLVSVAAFLLEVVEVECTPALWVEVACKVS